MFITKLDLVMGWVKAIAERTSWDGATIIRYIMLVQP